MSVLDIHREFPQSPDSEQGTLCGILQSPEEVLDLCDEKGVTPDTFYLPAHQCLYRTFQRLRSDNKPIEFITIAQYLRDRDMLEAIGGASFLIHLSGIMPSPAYVSHHIAEIIDKQTLRGVIEICTSHAGQSYDNPEKVAHIVDSLQAKALAISEKRLQTEVPIKDAVMEALSVIQACYDNKGKLSGLPTGFQGYDRLCDGLHDTDLVIIAARPSHGKTAFAMNVAEWLAVDKGMPVGVISAEMSRGQLVQRLILSRSKVNMSRIREGYMAERDFPAIIAAAEQIARAPIYIDDTANVPLMKLCAIARRWKKKHGIRALFVDYLQLVRCDAQNREREIAIISSSLKGLAKDLNIPVIALCQIGRDAERRGPLGRPRLSDLRESGSIEQDADFVGFLSRPEMYAETEEEKENLRGIADLIVAKNRNGPTGDIALTFLKEYARFEDRAMEPEQATFADMEATKPKNTDLPL